MNAISAAEATAEVFYTTFNALSKKEKQAFITRLLQHKEFSEDLVVDAAIIDKRRNEPSRSLDAYLAERASRQ